MVRTISIEDLQAHAVDLLERIAPYEEIIVEQSGKPVARITGVSKSGKKRTLGSARGQVWIAEDFDAPDPALEARFEEGDIEPRLLPKQLPPDASA